MRKGRIARALTLALISPGESPKSAYPGARRALALKFNHCADGFAHGIDYDQTFAPVANMPTFRLFLWICAYFDLEVSNADVSTAYLNAPAEKDIYMKCDKDLLQKLKELKKTLHGNERHRVNRLIIRLMKGESLLLFKAIYGSKSAGRQWFLDIDAFLKEIGFVSNKAAPCFYSIIIGKDFVILLLYVDDIIIGATTTALKVKYYDLLRKKYKMTFNEILTDFLNIALTRDRTKKQYHMSQSAYVEAFYETFQLPKDASVQTPFTENLRILSTERGDLTPAQRTHSSAPWVANAIGM